MADELTAEIERAFYVEFRRAWRQLVSDWQAAEGEVYLVLATAAVHRRRPGASDSEVLHELQRLGIVARDGAVIVPPLPGQQIVPVSSRPQ